MTKQEILRAWQQTIFDAQLVLTRFHCTLITWKTNNHDVTPEEFNIELDKLADAGLLYDWADRNTAGGGLDSLFEAVTGHAP